ncbi:hypothetical protein Murru_1157 [Allomuricauda ruestringensis DSM 13258]|uniref:Uncharacterized protein n=1 Tax=Allomuricauda ruestringensis (strain DSM 13258 / CIP 107369 / LMG 19739 / B1) TaxID=886377 RepID=G2PN77_ALLRU|nr:hypothetical protein Murru_1157 [Allomuricauda ruestringensis DSM 13258]
MPSKSMDAPFELMDDGFELLDDNEPTKSRCQKASLN